MKSDSIRWQYFPKSEPCPPILLKVSSIFENNFDEINSNAQADLKSNDVLRVLTDDLTNLGFEVETGKKVEETIPVPVLYGENGQIDKTFAADAWHRSERVVLEVEAGRAVSNNQFLKDLFQACIMDDVEYLVIAVRQNYLEKKDRHLIHCI